MPYLVSSSFFRPVKEKYKSLYYSLSPDSKEYPVDKFIVNSMLTFAFEPLFRL